MTDLFTGLTFLFAMCAFGAALNVTRYGVSRKESDISTLIAVACLLADCVFCGVLVVWKGGL